MTTAYLIQAHANPDHFGRLTEALQGPGARAFAHIDAKADAAPFRERAAAGTRFLDRRHRVYWGDFSQVDASLELLRTALSQSPAPRYLALLSGADYPLASQEEIAEVFAASRGRIYMNALSMPCPGKPLSRLAHRRIAWLDRRPVAHRAIMRLRRRSPWLLTCDPRRALRGLTPHAGSSWWVLPRGAAEYVLDFCRRRPEVVAFFRRTDYADEMFFQTILCNSVFRERIFGGLTWADWNDGARSPATLTVEALARLQAARAPATDHPGIAPSMPLFARKFPNDSAALIESLAWRRGAAGATATVGAAPPRRRRA